MRAELGPPERTGRIDQPLDSQPAATIYTVLSFDAGENTSLLEIRTVSGRKHQIRRHLTSIGHPVMGDPAYGRSNKTSAGLQLCATRLGLICPYQHHRLVFDLNRLLPGQGCSVCS